MAEVQKASRARRLAGVNRRKAEAAIQIELPDLIDAINQERESLSELSKTDGAISESKVIEAQRVAEAAIERGNRARKRAKELKQELWDAQREECEAALRLMAAVNNAVLHDKTLELTINKLTKCHTEVERTPWA